MASLQWLLNTVYRLLPTFRTAPKDNSQLPPLRANVAVEFLNGFDPDDQKQNLCRGRGRVLDVLGKVWKVRWLGLGASYFFGDHFGGCSAGLDLRIQI